MADSKPELTSDELIQSVYHYSAWVCLIMGPPVLLLPPRKLDFYTFTTLIGMFAGANRVSFELTGISMIERMGQRLAASTSALPLQAVELQQRRAREEMQKNLHNIVRTAGKNNVEQDSNEEVSPGSNQSTTGFWRKVWMGSEGENWKEERIRKEREALESGKGYFDLIVDQVWEVWNKDGKESKNNPTQEENQESKQNEPLRDDKRENNKISKNGKNNEEK